jgi:hypothetical protein
MPNRRARVTPPQGRQHAAGAAAVALAALLLCTAGPLAAQAAPQPGIYTCLDDKGRRLTSDRPIAECSAKEQRVLNRDGSLKGIHPPTLTAEERTEKEARDRKAAEARAAQADAARRDRNLVARYPNEETHGKAREAALDTVRVAIKASQARVKSLAAERKPLLDEAEFYQGRALPLKLRQQMDANDAAVEAQRGLMATQEAELVRIQKLYDLELDRLRRLWAGAPAGSLGPTPSAAAPGSATAPR